jgi:GDPmannose 4,6-dehydratase
MASALITGISGQDGSYLADLLLAKGYLVHGVARGSSGDVPKRLVHLHSDPAVWGKRLILHYAELENTAALKRILTEAAPDEVYHLAGQSHVGLSFENPEPTCELIALGTLRLLELIRAMQPMPRFFHASSSEIFGQPASMPQDERTLIAPISPYGCAKAFATQMAGIYRKTYGLFAANGILYNHESPRRGETFVTRKICLSAAAIAHGRQSELLLGDLAAERDWGHAADYVEGMWRTLQQPAPDDFVFATGQLHTVQQVVEIAFATAGLDWREYVRKDARFVRPSDPYRLVGNAEKAKRLLGWEPRVSFAQLITEMTEAELRPRGKPRPIS